MAQKIRYQYTVYEGYPKATQISKDREKSLTFTFGLVFPCIAFLVLFGLLSIFSMKWEGILMIVGGLVGGFLLFKVYTPWYQKKTKEKIARAIEEENANRIRKAQELKEAQKKQVEEKRKEYEAHKEKMLELQKQYGFDAESSGKS